MTIPSNSRSYPYLALAQRMGVPYGHVLWYATYVEQNLKTVAILGSAWFTASCQQLSEKQKQCIMNTVRDEWRRRKETSTSAASNSR